MGTAPSKVGSSLSSEKFENLTARPQSSMSAFLDTDQALSQILRNAGASRKLYRKNCQNVWYGSQGALNHQSNSEMGDQCHRCTALCQLLADKDIIVGSLESMLADMRMQMSTYNKELRDVRSRMQSKKQALSLRLFEARERICFLEELCSANKVSVESVPYRCARIYDMNSSQDSDCESENEILGDEDDGLRHHLTHLTPRSYGVPQYKRPSTSGSSSRGRSAQRSSSVLQYKRRPQQQANSNTPTNNQLLSASQTWALASSEGSGDSVRNSQSSEMTRHRHEPRRSATISAGSYAAMMGQRPSKRRV